MSSHSNRITAPETAYGADETDASLTTVNAGPIPARAGAFRVVMFRVTAAVIALLLLVGFGAWQSILTPWLALADSGGHGWERTPELHRLADSASALLMAGVGLAALFLAIRPAGHTALVSWTAATLGAIGAVGTVSAAIQGQDVLNALLFTVVWIAVLVVPFVLLHPERAAVLRGGPFGGSFATTLGGPSPLARAGLLVLGAAGLAMAAAVVLWRVGGGIFENPQEDDVVGLALLGLSLTLGAFLCVRRRTGWRALAWLLCGMGAYCVAAGVTIALG
ncbi:hypothetical protein ART_0070 [Arthrobacter sp. PAMC 25486]|uniref:hypothetical protein n=1 Tax=Arthrobacter sp. PAMC 25486 TaxID=1494608 RepID=UPI000535C7EC|nr:hypothetical protein [Arthrobacter sp. PAMC 25486]AIX99668.1 hypothetical protein ART_0070 [Arthrobacter sp. PAMC 25486]